MVGNYTCPKCSGTEVTWDRGTGKAVCPKDKTSVDNYRVVAEGKKK
jgi:transcription initiation factor TFIIIB Brf1 subunit/transcription initiation factor TFIIB